MKLLEINPSLDIKDFLAYFKSQLVIQQIPKPRSIYRKLANPVILLNLDLSALKTTKFNSFKSSKNYTLV